MRTSDKEDLPQGQVTFLFTDLVGSTQLWEAYPEAMREALARHDRLLKQAISAYRGRTIKTTGDGIHAAFASPVDAVSAAIESQKRMAAEEWAETGPLLVRMGLHIGDSHFREGDYYGSTLNRAARIMSIGHGGQILTSAAVQALLNNAPALPFQLQDLGDHQLKGFSRPEKIYQVLHPDLASTFPPLLSIAAIPNNLPLQATEFVGREREIAALKQEFRGTRLLTLTGPGGTGKTRLALQTAAELLDDYPDGVFFVDLTRVNVPSLLPSTIAEALQVKETESEPLLERLKHYLEPKHLLLVLDNFEHIIEAAPAVGELLAAGPDIHILVTSRELLHIAGEQLYPVQPLGLPESGAHIDPAHISSYEAIQLFSNRARAANPAFQITPENVEDVARICRQLDGLPLAIELAAARVRLFTPKKLLERLSDRLKILTGGGRDRHARQQTLRGAIDWSYDLLDPAERKLFARLEVFSGGRSLEAIETVCGTDLEIDILDGLASLLDKSLISQEEDFEGQPRFVMLETLHAYARERHREYEEWPAIHAAHAQWVLTVAEAAGEGILGQTPNIWVERLKSDEGNIRAVLERCLSGDLDAEIGVRLAGALPYFWEYTGKFSEGLSWLEAMLSLSAGMPGAIRAMALSGAGLLSYWRGDWQKSAIYSQEALEIGLEIGDNFIVGEALHFLAHVAQNKQDNDLAEKLLADSLESFLATDHRWGMRRTRVCLADAQRLAGKYELAAGNFEEVLEEQRKQPEDVMLSMLLSNYANVLNRQGNYPLARDYFLEGIQLSLGLNHELLTAYLVDGLAGNMVLSGNPEEAALLMGASQALMEAAGITSMAAVDQYDHDYYLSKIEAALDQATLAERWKKGKGMTLQETAAHVLDRVNPVGA